jgi:hypothetical protein
MAIEDYYRPLTAHMTTQTVDKFGDTVTTLSAGVEFMGHIGKPSSAAAERMAKRGVFVTGRLYAPVFSPVDEFFVIVEKDTGAAFQVVSEPRDAARRGHHIEADLTEWRGGVE